MGEAISAASATPAARTLRRARDARIVVASSSSRRFRRPRMKYAAGI
jgi:hypothetical protein